MPSQRYDIVYSKNSVEIQPHFCRDHDCFGTNPNHGFTFEEAKEEVVAFYSRLANQWADSIEDDLFPDQAEKEE